MELSILYRGSLSSCNYACGYCPFAKHYETPAQHEADQAELERFVAWVEGQDFPIRVFFTPWGEALIRERYRKAMVRLSHLPQVQKVAIQTNLSCRIDWVEEADKSKLAFWATYHPSEVSGEQFVQKCLEVDRRGVRFSVGAVGIKENIPAIQALRTELPGHIYLWVNAYKSRPGYYSSQEIERLTAIDPLFPINTEKYRSRGKPCRAGETVISVDGDGTVRRCHFVDAPIGNIYDANFAEALKPRPCSRGLCDCHIGYVHLDELKLYEVFGDGVLERIPANWGMVRLQMSQQTA